MVLLEVAMYIKDIQEEECETAIKVNFIDPQNGKAAEGDDPSNIKQHETILTACWKYPEEQHQSFEFTKCPSVHECWCILSKEICMHAVCCRYVKEYKMGVLSAAAAPA